MIFQTLAAAPLDLQQLKVLLVVLAGVAVLMGLIRGVGEILARTHPEAGAPAKAKQPAAPAAVQPPKPEAIETLSIHPITAIKPEVLAVIGSAVSTMVDGPFRILSVSSPRTPPVESLMQVWSWEGRRQIYSSHKVR